MITLTGIKKHTCALGMSLLLLAIGQQNAQAAVLNLPNSPLFILNTVDPNVILTLDDSGSMAWGFVPDQIGSTLSGSGVNLSTSPRGCSKTINGVAYDPNTIYTPPPLANGSGDYPDMPFTAAMVNGYDTAATPATVDLSAHYKPVWGTNTTTTSITNSSYASCSYAATGGTGVPAFYYVYNSTPHVGCLIPNSNTDACYDRVDVSSTSGPGGTDERVNFANWYSYYRTRNLAMKSAGGRALARAGNNVRMAYMHLNTCNTALGGAPTAACPGTYVKPFSGTNRSDFFTWLYSTPANNSTPLVQAAERARVYLTTTGTNSPWAEYPGTSIGTEHSCRQNFHMMLTDGLWNGGSVGTNVDNATVILPDGMSYSPGSLPANRKIYPDTNVGYLADVVFNAWKTDARPTLTNNVPRYLTTISLTNPDDITLPGNTLHYWDPKNDPANWQHLVTFTVGLGVTGTLDPANYFDQTLPASAGDYDDLLAGTKNWNGGDVVDDLWHAAINGRGVYASARNPNTLIDTFINFISQVNNRTASASSLGVNGTTTSGGTTIYQVAFNPSNWAGRMIATQLDVDGTPTTNLWEASTRLNTQNYLSTGTNGRNIITYNPSNAAGSRGVPFLWPSLNATQQNALNRTPSNSVDTLGSARLNYLRGASANEGAGLNFRSRTCYDPATVYTASPTTITCPADVGKLGDIIDSSATYVGKPPFDYPDALETVTYSSFRTTQTSRTPMVYVGANDGMLHAFNANTGIEQLAYVPNLVYTNDATNNLALLTWQTYTHRYYVDATPTMGDAFYGGAWHTVLVGGLRKGGRGYYALDITNPNSLSEANAANVARWEFTDPDLGYSYSQAAIVKVSDTTGTSGGSGKTGTWAAIFGNGYNNTGTGHAVLYVVNIETGALIKKIDTAVSGGGGSVTTPNGLATPAVIDIDDDKVADYVYAGDLQGKMWRFDIRSGTTADWSLATNVTPLFTARDALTNNVQPITDRPSVGFHPYGFGGLMVYFGTGKYLESSDNTTTGTPQTQTFYGIYDRGVTASQAKASAQETVLRSDLLGQTISTNTTINGFNTRGVSNNPITYRLSKAALPSTYLGWFVDLPTNGEKQVTDPVLREGRIIFTTLIPSIDPCTPGGTGWLMELNTENGGQLKDTFDLSGPSGTVDGLFTGADRIMVGGTSVGAAGVQSTTGGALSSPIVLTSPPTSRPPAAGSAACKEVKLAQATDGSIVKIAETCRPAGRESWRQVK